MDTECSNIHMSGANQKTYLLVSLFKTYIITAPTAKNWSQRRISSFTTLDIKRWSTSLFIQYSKNGISRFLFSDSCTLFYIRRSPHAPETKGLLEFWKNESCNPTWNQFAGIAENGQLKLISLPRHIIPNPFSS